VKPIADADFDENFEDLDLPKAIKKGLILHRGELTPDYKYLEEFIPSIPRSLIPSFPQSLNPS
jgi:alpha-aminoadipic semialdehyde synthase